MHYKAKHERSIADVNAREEELNGTALTIAAQFNPSKAVLEALLKAGADVNAQTSDGITALAAARQCNTPEVIKALEAAGAK